jgi:predicted GIY-YIG superfamily endonuclease
MGDRLIIYKITNKTNGKVYIGKTKRSLEARWKQHCRDAFDGRFWTKGKLQYAIQEFGADAFTVEQIDVAASNDETNEKEMYWIKHYNSIETGYNTSPGGRNGGHYQKVINVETGEVFNSMVEAAEAYGVSHAAIPQAVKYGWKCSGFHWKKLD